MAYELDQFIADCRNSLKRDPGPGGREQVRAHLERLLGNRDFVEKYCGDNVERGLKVLYEDPELKFQVLAHINDKARVSPPHDHGASWAIYGQARLWTDMTEWKREDDGTDPKHAKLTPEKSTGSNPATPASIRTARSTRSTIRTTSRFIRVTGTNLDRIDRPLRPEDRRGASDDAAAGDLSDGADAVRGRRGGAARDAARRHGSLRCSTCARSGFSRKAISCSRVRFP